MLGHVTLGDQFTPAEDTSTSTNTSTKELREVELDSAMGSAPAFRRCLRQ